MYSHWPLRFVSSFPISAICYSLFSFVFLSNIASENFGLGLYTIHLLQANRCEFNFPFRNFGFCYFKGRKMETFHAVSTLGFMSKLWSLTKWKTDWLNDQPTEWSETKRVSCIPVNNNKQTLSLFCRPNWKHLYTISVEENISSFFLCFGFEVLEILCSIFFQKWMFLKLTMFEYKEKRDRKMIVLDTASEMPDSKDCHNFKIFTPNLEFLFNLYKVWKAPGY